MGKGMACSMLIDQSDLRCTFGAGSGITTEFIAIEKCCLSRFDSYIKLLNISGPIAALYDTNTFCADNLVRPAVDQEIILSADGLHADEKAVGEVLSRLRPDAKAIVALGSGTIHDVARYCAYERALKLISCPTAASVDGFCSNVAAMTWNGSKKTLPAVAPSLVLADLSVIAAAPVRLAKSGIGDILGKYIALADWKISNILTGERYAEKIAETMTSAVNIINDCSAGILTGDSDAYEKLIYGLLLSGLAMQVFGNSRPASGAEHHISHLIEMHPSPLGLSSTALHGEKVGVGTIIMSETYHRFAANSRTDRLHYSFTPVTRENILPYFGCLTGSIMEENKSDCLLQLNPDSLYYKWGEVCREINAIPNPDILLALYERLGLKRRLQDIGVDEDKKNQLVLLCPLVRNRLTLARIIRQIAVH